MIVMSEREVIIKTALKSRLLLILLQYVSNLLIPDHKADAFIYPKSPQNGFMDKLVHHFLGGFVRWDAHHFMHISQNGYTYEHNLAFFPFCPMLVRYIVVILSGFTPFFNSDSLTLLVFVIINTVSFVLSALCLYELSRFILNRDLSYKTVVFFCYNPASVFFTAPYTESIFSYLSFRSMLNCILLYKKYCDTDGYLQVTDIVYVIPICLSTITRSNGVLNIGFLIYTLLCLYFKHLKEVQLQEKFLHLTKFILLIIFLIVLCMTPLILFQIYSFKWFCTDFDYEFPEMVLSYAKSEDFIVAGTFSQHNQSWCYKKIPLAYSYIQSHYWKVGFLQYYHFKQIPNFILAFPVVFIVLSGAIRFFKIFLMRLENLFNFDRMFHKRVHYSTFNSVMVVFIIHATALTIFCVLNIHVQVTTRMLCSASPVLYWFSVFYFPVPSQSVSFKKLVYRNCSIKEYSILFYFISYYVIGTVLFCNFLPWT